VTIELILADPHPVMLEGLERVFRSAPGFAVRSRVNDGHAAWEAVQRWQPHILIHEMQLTHKDGPGLIRAIQNEGLRTRPVVFTSASRHQAQAALALGARGLISKNRTGQALLDCVHAVMEGQAWLDPDLLTPDGHESSSSPDTRPVEDVLTSREIGVARLVIEGLSNKRIASRLNITEGTTKLHLHHIYQKLQCPGRIALMIYLRNQGLP
jgi:DNA-binding NarL/FixJ family response regulator